jgi:hypothetical protein
MSHNSRSMGLPNLSHAEVRVELSRTQEIAHDVALADLPEIPIDRLPRPSRWTWLRNIVQNHSLSDMAGSVSRRPCSDRDGLIA